MQLPTTKTISGKKFEQRSISALFPLSEDKPTGISLDVSGGVVNIVPHDLSLWRNVIRQVEIESLTVSEGMKPNKA